MSRKEWKKAGRQSFHKHYLILVCICILMALFGSEASYSVQILKLRTGAKVEREGETILRADDVFDTLVQGDLSLGQQLSETLLEAVPDEIGGNPALGTTSGVLAGVVSSVMSGQIYLKVAESIFNATQSPTLAGFLFLLFYAAILFAVWFFFRNVSSVWMRRVFLEARTYKKVPFTDLFHCFKVRKWLHACVAMFLEVLFLSLWWLTIIGGIIKTFSYYLVPYIVAENPGIRARDAIKLSRRMMYGHKWEAFKLELSFIGWYLLAWVTVGLSDAFYAFPYRTAARAEYYAYLRGLAKQNNLEGAEALNDTYLYEIGDKITLYENYFDVVDMQTLVLEKERKYTGARAFILKWFSIWVGSMNSKRIYEEVEGYKYRIEKEIQCRDGIAYPLRLSPLWKERKKLSAPFSFLRAYSVWSLLLMFLLFCFIGWGWEVGLYMQKVGHFVNRGVLHGPWLPIYGSGGIVVLLICSRFRKNPLVELLVSVGLCGVIEYLGAYMLETRYHERWWSYDGCFLNIHGRVCAEGLIVFGIACMLVVYLLAPLFDFLVSKLPNKVLRGIAIALFAVFLFDLIYSRFHPNMADGAIEKHEVAEVLWKLQPEEDLKIPLPISRQA